ncbi:MAG: molybdopterin-dependent oxidoreductase, partial [Roseovarius sp.]
MDGSAMPEVRSTCPYCGVGCGVLLRADGAGGLDVRGDPDHPANRGRLCSKGAALGETVGLENRLLTPRVDGQDVGWDRALQHVADRFSQTIAQHGPDSVAFYVSGQMLTEDYYVANKLMKGFIGSANIDTNSRLCMASSVAGHKRAFGSDTVPGTYEDIDEADLVVLVGSNLAWCHPVLYQRLLGARAARGTKIVVIDPRRTASCDGADMHLALEPGSDVALFNRLFREIYDGGACDADFLRHTSGYDETLHTARIESGAATGLSDAEITAFCR